MRVVVTGATGFIGSSLVPVLLERGHEVRVLVRDASSYDAPEGVDVFEGDLLEPESLAGVFDGVDAAYYLVHSLSAGEDFAERDRHAARNFAEAASGKVERVVYLGGLGVSGEELSEHLASRREVESILADGGYNLTILRAAVVIGAGSASFRMIRQLVEKLPVMTTPRWVRTPCQPIALEDAVAYLAGVLDAPETAGGTYEIGGPEVLSYEEMMKRTARVMGYPNRPIVVRVPVLSPRISTYWVDFVTDVPRSIVHPLIHGMKNPVVVTDDSIDEHVTVEPTPFEEAVRRAVAAEAEAEAEAEAD